MTDVRDIRLDLFLRAWILSPQQQKALSKLISRSKKLENISLSLLREENRDESKFADLDKLTNLLEQTIMACRKEKELKKLKLFVRTSPKTQNSKLHDALKPLLQVYRTSRTTAEICGKIYFA